MDSLEFTVQDLRTFFQENRDEPVGIPCNDYECPIARYFSQRRNMSVRVQRESIYVRDGSAPWRWIPLEEWQKKFVDDFDRRFSEEGSASGQEATDILDEVIEDLGELYEDNNDEYNC